MCFALTKYSIGQRLIFKMMYRNVSYNNVGFHTNFYKETDGETAIEDDIWTAVSFSPDPDYNQTDFDIPINFEPAFFGERRVGASKIFKKGSDIC